MLPKGLLFLLSCAVTAQELVPTEQTLFNFPANGSGVLLPFPSELVQLTGLSNWPAGWVTPPFTPNMAKLYNASATATLNDISVPPDAKQFCQTFDDGPTNVTSILLDFLDSVDQKTTFFEIGSQIVQNYQLTQREYASGHQIADHTWSHPDLTSLSPQQVYAELAWTIYAIHAAIGQTPKYFRPPFGFINDNVRRVAAQLGLTAVIWTQTSNDWQIGSNPAYTNASVVSTVAGYIGRGDGEILLEHDLRQATVEVGITVSGMISQAGRLNYPIAAVLGDAQRYQGTKLVWPVVGPNGFDPSLNPIRDGAVPQVPNVQASPPIPSAGATASSTTKAALAASNAPFRAVTSSPPSSATTSITKLTSNANAIEVANSIWTLFIASVLGIMTFLFL